MVLLALALLGSCGPAVIGTALASGSGSDGGGSPPSPIVSQSPDPGSASVAVDAPVVVTLVDRVDPNTVDEFSFFVTEDTGQMVSLDFSAAGETFELALKTGEEWDLAATYTIHLTSAVLDMGTPPTALFPTGYSSDFTIRDGVFQSASQVPTTSTQKSLKALYPATGHSRWAEAVFVDEGVVETGPIDIQNLEFNGMWSNGDRIFDSSDEIQSFSTSLDADVGLAGFSRASGNKVQAAQAAGGSWGTSMNVVNQPNNNEGSILAVAAGDDRHAIWVQPNSDTLLYRRNPPGGGPPHPISPDGDPGDVIDVTLTASGEFVAALYVRDPGNAGDQKLYETHQTAALEWESSPQARQIQTNRGTVSSPRVVIAGTTGIAVWIEAGQVYAASYDLRGGPDIDDLGQVDTPGMGCDSCATSVDARVGADAVLICWTERDPTGTESLHVRVLDTQGMEFGSEQTPSEDIAGDVVGNLSVWIDAHDNILMVWTEDVSGTLQVWSRRLRSTGLMQDQLVFSDATSPLVALRPDGRGVVVAESTTTPDTFEFSLFE